MSDNTQELDEILEGVANEYSAGGNYENAKPLMVEEAKQVIIDWHNKQIEEVLDRLETQALELPLSNGREMNLVDVSDLEAERNKLKESK